MLNPDTALRTHPWLARLAHAGSLLVFLILMSVGPATAKSGVPGVVVSESGETHQSITYACDYGFVVRGREIRNHKDRSEVLDYDLNLHLIGKEIRDLSGKLQFIASVEYAFSEDLKSLSIFTLCQKYNYIGDARLLVYEAKYKDKMPGEVKLPEDNAPGDRPDDELSITYEAIDGGFSGKGRHRIGKEERDVEVILDSSGLRKSYTELRRLDDSTGNKEEVLLVEQYVQIDETEQVELSAISSLSKKLELSAKVTRVFQSDKRAALVSETTATLAGSKETGKFRRTNDLGPSGQFFGSVIEVIGKNGVEKCFRIGADCKIQSSFVVEKNSLSLKNVSGESLSYRNHMIRTISYPSGESIKVVLDPDDSIHPQTGPKPLEDIRPLAAIRCNKKGKPIQILEYGNKDHRGLVVEWAIVRAHDLEGKTRLEMIFAGVGEPERVGRSVWAYDSKNKFILHVQASFIIKPDMKQVQAHVYRHEDRNKPDATIGGYSLSYTGSGLLNGFQLAGKNPDLIRTEFPERCSFARSIEHCKTITNYLETGRNMFSLLMNSPESDISWVVGFTQSVGLKP